MPTANTSHWSRYRSGQCVIIFNHDDCLTSLIIAGVDNLQTRREHLTEQFFLRNVLKEQSSLHCLLPTKRDLNIVNRLRHAKTFELSQSRTEKFRKSFIPYCLANFISNRSYELFYLFTYLHYFFIIVYNPANAAILNKPFIHSFSAFSSIHKKYYSLVPGLAGP